MSSGNVTSDAQNCPPHARAEQCTVHAITDCRICRAERARRTDESHRAERAFRDWSAESPADRPLQKHQAAHARVLFEWMKEHGISRCRFADMLGVNEKQVRKMLKGSATIPSAVSSCIPASLRSDYLERLGELGGGALQDRIDRLTMAEALEASRQITDRIARLAGSQ